MENPPFILSLSWPYPPPPHDNCSEAVITVNNRHYNNRKKVTKELTSRVPRVYIRNMLAIYCPNPVVKITFLPELFAICTQPSTVGGSKQTKIRLFQISLHVFLIISATFDLPSRNSKCTNFMEHSVPKYLKKIWFFNSHVSNMLFIQVKKSKKGGKHTRFVQTKHCRNKKPINLVHQEALYVP